MRLPKPISAGHADLRIGMLVLAILVATGVQAKKGDTAQLNETEILETLVDTDLVVRRGAETATARLRENGTSVAWGEGWQAVGGWMIFDDRLCFYLADKARPVHHCAAIEHVTKDIYWGDNGTMLQRVPD